MMEVGLKREAFIKNRFDIPISHNKHIQNRLNKDHFGHSNEHFDILNFCGPKYLVSRIPSSKDESRKRISRPLEMQHLPQEIPLHRKEMC